jgi:Domain of unknown function (DUF5658)
VSEPERRSGTERRHTTLASYWHGSLRPRRHSGRRATDQIYPVVDWHSPRVLALVITILGLCVLDGILTIILMSHGAREANPVMALFLPDDLHWFAAVKLTLTSVGMCVLVACSRMRLFRTIPGEALLYAVLAAYAALIAYELQLLEAIPLRAL